MTDVDTKLKEALRSSADDPPGEQPHPPDQRLIAYAEGRLPGDEAEQMRDHLATCAECTDALLDLAAFEAAVERLPQADGEPDRPSPWWQGVLDGARAALGGVRPGGGGALALPRPAAALAAAAALVLVSVAVVLVWRPATPLPLYTAELGGGVAVQRDGSERLFPPGSRLELTLRPQDAVEGELEVRAWRLGDDGPAGLKLPVESSSRGIVRLGGSVGREIDLRPGVNRLLVVVARAGRAPGVETLAGALAVAPEAQGDGWAAWRIEVDVGEVD